MENRHVEQRLALDRRQRPTGMLAALRLKGRRRGFRRDGEGINAYTDWAEPRTALLVIFVVVASGLDALFTLFHLIDGGATEANPVMNFALKHGVMIFLAAKVALTAFGTCFLAVHQHFPLGFKGLRILAILYAVLLT